MRNAILRIGEFAKKLDFIGILSYDIGMLTEIEKNISKNIKELRLRKGLKQSELGEMLSYSDKTVSKWENGSSVPDVTALAEIAELFSVTVDDLLRENAVEKVVDKTKEKAQEDRMNDIAMLCLSVLSVITIAVVIYVALMIIKDYKFWQVYVWAVPPSAVIIYKYNKAHANYKWLNAVALSVLNWGLITAIYLTMLGYNVWPLFFLGIPLQAMIIISTIFRKTRSFISLSIFRVPDEEKAKKDK